MKLVTERVAGEYGRYARLKAMSGFYGYRYDWLWPVWLRFQQSVDWELLQATRGHFD